MSYSEWVMFIPANGEGSRVAERGPKHSLTLPEGVTAIKKVASMAPIPMQVEVAFRTPPENDTENDTDYDVYIPGSSTIHFMHETSGQASTIYEWLQRTRHRQYVMISNCDNWIDANSVKLGMRLLEDNRATCVVPTFRPRMANDPRFSYVKQKSGNLPKQLVEHKPVSDQAVAGVYFMHMDQLLACLWPDDIYLSQTISRMQDFYSFQVEQYMGWGDMDQLNEIEQGLPQYRID
jgi:hypothetical protein